MARASWKRPGSPIGKKGPRKANPSYKSRTREPCSSADVKMLKQLANGNTPTGVMSAPVPKADLRTRHVAPCTKPRPFRTRHVTGRAASLTAWPVVAIPAA